MDSGFSLCLDNAMKIEPDSMKSLIAAWAIQEYKNYRSNKDRMSPSDMLAYLKFFVSDCERRNVAEFAYSSAKALIEKVKYDHQNEEETLPNWT